MNPDGQMAEATRLRALEDAARAERKREAARRQLTRFLEKKIQTAFVGDLSRCEEAFGRLWGHGKADEDRTPQERQWAAAWQALRHGILENGNAQIRAVRAEMGQYRVEWDRPRATLLVEEERRGEGE